MIHFLPRSGEAATFSLSLPGKKSRSLCWKQKVLNVLYLVFVATNQGWLTTLLGCFLSSHMYLSGGSNIPNQMLGGTGEERNRRHEVLPCKSFHLS